MITTKEIIDYVMESPHNTNPAVLRSLLNQYSGGGGVTELNTFKLIITNNTGKTVRPQFVNPRIIDGKLAITQSTPIKDNETLTFDSPFSYGADGTPSSSTYLYIGVSYTELSDMVVTALEEGVTCTFTYASRAFSAILISGVAGLNEVHLTLSLPS